MADAVKFSGTLSEITIDRGRFTKALQKQCQTLVRQAARAWLREVILHVRVWSGETKGSIKFAKGPQGNLARYLNVAVPINAPHPRPNKNERTGTGDFEFTSENNHFGFKFGSDVLQYYLNEFFVDVSPTSPWLSLAQASVAYSTTISNGMAKLPKIQDYVLVTPEPLFR